MKVSINGRYRLSTNIIVPILHGAVHTYSTCSSMVRASMTINSDEGTDLLINGTYEVINLRYYRHRHCFGTIKLNQRTKRTAIAAIEYGMILYSAWSSNQMSFS